MRRERIPNYKEMLDDPKRSINETTHTLARLWRVILSDTKVQPHTWDWLMREYLRNPHFSQARTSKDRSSERGNLNRELSRPELTWNTFMKGMDLLHPYSVRFIAEITWREGTEPTQHSVTRLININDKRGSLVAPSNRSRIEILHNPDLLHLESTNLNDPPRPELLDVSSDLGAIEPRNDLGLPETHQPLSD